MNDNFLLYKHVKEFSFEMMKYSNNIPKSLMYIKKNMQNSFDYAIRLIKYYIVNSNETNRAKLKYLKDLVVKISMLDYYLECLYHARVLGKNKFQVYSTEIENNRKLAFGVINSERKSAQV